MTRTEEAFDPGEWQARVELAACYRLIALHGWDDLLATHVSLRLPGSADEPAPTPTA